MRRGKGRAFVLGALALVAAMALPAMAFGLHARTAGAAPGPKFGSPPAGCFSPWQVVSSPNGSSTDANLLERVAVISPGEAWAVGGALNFQTGVSTVMAEHFTNGAWGLASPSPTGAPGGDFLFDVSAASASDVWAVGDFVDNTNTVQPLAEHWMGSSWTQMTVPTPGSSGGVLNGVVALASNNAWAVGSYPLGPTVNQTLIEHWDGTKWSIFASANVGSQDTELGSVAAISPTDIWASGIYIPASGPAFDTVIEHWNGTIWQIVSSPNGLNGSGDTNQLTDIAAVASGNVWSVGYTISNSTGRSQTLIEHWNATSWQIVPSPNPGGTDDELNGMTAVGPNEVIAVGHTQVKAPTKDSLIELWNGNSWNVVPSPNVSAISNNLVGIGASGPRTLWAVGSSINSSPPPPHLTLTMRAGGLLPGIPAPRPGSRFLCPPVAGGRATAPATSDAASLQRLAAASHGSLRAVYRHIAATAG